MKLKKQYKHDNKKQIWRILPISEHKVVVEEREPNTKEVFFSCFDIETGKKIFSEFQLDEKNWCGIESIYKDVIFFHTYGKPDMPNHKSIIAFDIYAQKILWKNDSYVFTLIYDDKVYCFQQRFESRVFYTLDYQTGNVIEELGSDVSIINQVKTKVDEEFWKQNYLFPEYFNRTEEVNEEHKKYLNNILTSKVIKGELSYLKYNDLLLYNFHEINSNNSLDNIFLGYDLARNKIILEEILDKNLTNLMPESFFVKNNFLFLIIDKTKLLVYKII